MKKISLLLSVAFLFSACAQPNFDPLESIASKAKVDISCKGNELEANLWSGLKTYLIENDKAPKATDLKHHFELAIRDLQRKNPGLTEEEAQKIITNLHELITTLLETAPAGEKVETPQELLLLLSAIDVGDQSTDFRAKLQKEVRHRFEVLSESIKSAAIVCENKENSPADLEVLEESAVSTPAFEAQKNRALSAGMPLALFGAKWAFATAYQSCQSVELHPMSYSTPDVEGIKITGDHSDGVGSKRIIASLSAVQGSHFYVRDVKQYGNGCFNVRSNPLIYDYGGKPYATTASNSSIDFFKNSGNGTNVLGIDCSGYVFSAMATAGLKLKAGRPLKASDAWGWGSSSYVEPQNNGLTCLSKITVTPASSLRSGDIVAVRGHVLMIDRVGSDPFGIRSAQSVKDCEKVNTRNFDFTVIQSSNSKNGIGINRYEAVDFLATSEKMKVGLERYAYYACMAKVSGRNHLPNLGTLSVVRHRGTQECVAPRVALAREACIQGCSRF